MAHTFKPRLSSARIEPPTSSTPSVALAVKSATLTFDSTWSPYVQGSLVCRRQSSADATATDPRKGLLTKFTLSQTVDSGAAQTLNVAAWLRSRVNDFGTDEATLTFAGVESLLQDQVDSAGQQYATAVTDLQIVQDALGRVGLANGGPISLSSTAAAAAFNVAAADAGWDVGVRIWDVINTVESTKSTWVHGDESGLVLYRQPAGYTADSSVRYLYGADTNGVIGRVVSVQDTIDRDSPDWANAVFISYAWNNGANVATDSAVASGVTSSTPLKSIVINRTGRRTATGEAAARVARSNKRGRTLVVTAIADLSARPNQNYFVGFRDVSWYGVVRSVQFQFPQGLMVLTIDITES